MMSKDCACGADKLIQSESVILIAVNCLCDIYSNLLNNAPSTIFLSDQDRKNVTHFIKAKIQP